MVVDLPLAGPRGRVPEAGDRATPDRGAREAVTPHALAGLERRHRLLDQAAVQVVRALRADPRGLALALVVEQRRGVVHDFTLPGLSTTTVASSSRRFL